MPARQKPQLNTQFVADFLASAKQYSVDYNSTFDAGEAIGEVFHSGEIGEEEVSILYIDLVKPIADAAEARNAIKLKWIESRGMDEQIGNHLDDLEARVDRLEQIRGVIYNFAFSLGKREPHLFPYLYNIAIWQPRDPRERGWS